MDFTAIRSVLNIGEMVEVLTPLLSYLFTHLITHVLNLSFNYSGSYEKLENIYMLTGNNGNPVIMDHLKWYFLLIDDPEAAPVGITQLCRAILFIHSPTHLFRMGNNRIQKGYDKLY